MSAAPALPQALASTIEFVLNRYLRFDPAALQRLQAFSGKVIALELQGLDWVFYLMPGCDGIRALNTYSGTVDTRLSGTPWAMMRMGTQKETDGETRAALFSGTVRISGDAELGRQFKAVLDSVEIDWEELLAQVTGDVIAHQVGNAVSSAQIWGRQVLDTLGQNFVEYQQEEIRNLPNKHEVEAWFASIDRLRDDVARLEQRTHRLQGRLTKHSEGQGE